MGTTVLDQSDVTLPDTWCVKEDSGVKGIEVVDDAKGIVEALVSVTGVKDRVNDIIIPGAYADTLTKRVPKGLLGHDWKELVSKAIEVKEIMPGEAGLPSTLPNGDPWPAEAGALYVKAQYNLNTQRGRDAYEDAKFFGPDQEWSIGYSVPSNGFTKDRNGVRHIKSLDLFEFSQVLWGAMPHARTSSIKSDDVVIETKDGKKLDKAITMADGSYPISDRASLKDAVQAYGRSKDKEACKKHIMHVAHLLGASDVIPDDWGKKSDDVADVIATKDDENNSESGGTMDLEKIMVGFKAMAEFLHGHGAISDELYTKVVGETVEEKSFDTAAGIIDQVGPDIFDDSQMNQAKVLALSLDDALELKDDRLVEIADRRLGAFLSPFVKDDSKRDAVAYLAQKVYELRGVTEDDDAETAVLVDDTKDDESDKIESKSDVVQMSREEMLRSLGL